MKKIVLILLNVLMLLTMAPSREKPGFRNLLWEAQQLWNLKNDEEAATKIAEADKLMEVAQGSETVDFIKMSLKVAAVGDEYPLLVEKARKLRKKYDQIPMAGLLISLSDELVRENRNDLARAVAKASVDLFPDSLESFLKFSHLFVKTGHLKEALNFHSEIIARETGALHKNVDFLRQVHAFLEINRPYIDEAVQDAIQKIDYKFRVIRQEQYYEIDPKNKLFRSDQTYTIRNSGREGTRRILFAVFPQLQIQELSLKDADGKTVSTKRRKLFAFDNLGWPCFPVFELETESDIVPNQELKFHIQYRINPDTVAQWPEFWWFLTVSQNSSYSITPRAGNNVVFGLNLSSPFVVKIKHPEEDSTCVPGNRTTIEKEGRYLIETYESKTPNIPVFSCAPYKKIERRNLKVSVEYFLYPQETLPEEMADYFFAAASLFSEYFGENGTNSYRVATAGLFQATSSNAENKGNCIFMTDEILREAQKTPGGRRTYLGMLFHEIFHNWNLFSIDWDGDYAEWFGEGGANFIMAWAVEKTLGAAAAVESRKDLLIDFIARRGFSSKTALNKARKNGDADSALIYGYGALVWEQLRQKLGDEIFFSGLGDFFKKNLFRTVTINDFFLCWEPYTKINIKEYLGPWINHNARIALSIEKAETQAKGDHYETAVTVNVDSDRDYEISTAIEFRMEKEEKGNFRPLHFMKKGIQIIKFESPKEPLFMQLDPHYLVPRIDDGKTTWKK
jgi:hypothetical protein